MQKLVGAAVIDQKLSLWDDLGGQLRGDFDRHDLVVAAVHHQDRHVDLLQVLAEVGLRESPECVVGGEQAGRLPLPSVTPAGLQRSGRRAG